MDYMEENLFFILFIAKIQKITICYNANIKKVQMKVYVYIKKKLHITEGKGCRFNGALHGLCNDDIKCRSEGTECNTKTGNGICVCKRYHNISETGSYCEPIDTKGLLGGRCGNIGEHFYVCRETDTECVQVDEKSYECRCKEGYRTNPETYKCEKVEKRMLISE